MLPKKKDLSKQKTIDSTLDSIETNVAESINDRVSQLSRIIPEIKLLLSPILELDYKVQQELENLY